MRVKYIGESFYGNGLTDGRTYKCLGAENAGMFGATLRVIDDSEEDYLYSAKCPGPWNNSSPAGKWEIVEDDEKGTLKKAIYEGIVEE